MAARQIDFVCGHCGSNEVSLDAWAAWDVGLQDWMVRETFPTGYCHACEGETKLIERAIALEAE